MMLSKIRATATAVALVMVLTLSLTGCAGTLGVQEGGFNLISVDQEWQMREDLKRQVAKQMTVVRDPAANAYLDRLGREIVAQTGMANLPWEFGIIQDDSINAFNLPGGLVYIHTGLIEEADDLDQMVGVLSHEVAHGVARHGTQMMTRQYGFSMLASLVLGENPSAAEQIVSGLAGTGILMDYSRDAEREADRLGVRYMYEAGYDPTGMADFFRVLMKMQERRPSDVERFFSSHPMSSERVENVEDLVSTLPQKNLVSDTEEFQRFKARF